MKHPNQLILIFLILNCFAVTAMGQSTSPGFLISLEGDTIAGTIRTVGWRQAPDLINHFIVETGEATPANWEAKDIRQYTIGVLPGATRGKGRTFYAKVWPHNGMRQFLEPREAGKAQLFVVPDPQALPDRKKSSERVVFDPDFQASRDDAYYVSSEDTELVIRLEKENYDLILKQVLKDCPSVTDNIGQRKFRFNNLEKIIALYNSSCE
ncbi:hypothetical protein [Flavilitoribacter nigricans]|uniref:Uncharacterized protein n=1 Tax=Flavilitoribacter nigricans (strain ATCC 23147 / DSM 23189 / NBRC 102662 / NCIMB 1420 / SS-2) TaxID=1122177 RepID=A0A2D0N9U0_FLAN2|nr:hypothetical protein [Flavilitoribacter nigricans]PHN05247.1 hypothetical protein CRP01_17160 [Flavilitoribacter nigricans DSM 23189 = NBRC 102662]